MEQIETAYRRNIKAWHPDRFANDPTMHAEAGKRTAQINEAWEKIKQHRGI